MLRKLILLTIACFATIAIYSTPSAITAGDKAYRARNYIEAAKLYTREVQNSPSSSTYYNLGNAQYRLRNYGQAVLSYRRALRLDPSDTAARHNLAVVESHLTDNTVMAQPDLWENLLERTVYAHGTTYWTAWSFVLLICAFAGFYFWRLYPLLFVRKIGFVFMLVTGLGFALTTISAARARIRFTSNDLAVVTDTELSARTSPSDRAKVQSTLHEGTTVTILPDQEGKYLRIRLPDGTEAWITSSGVTRVIENRR